MDFIPFITWVYFIQMPLNICLAFLVIKNQLLILINQFIFSPNFLSLPSIQMDVRPLITWVYFIEMPLIICLAFIVIQNLLLSSISQFIFSNSLSLEVFLFAFLDNFFIRWLEEIQHRLNNNMRKSYCLLNTYDQYSKINEFRV